MACFSCGRGFHSECTKKKGCKKCHPAVKTQLTVITGNNRGAPIKDPSSMKDLESTGRKRAAMLWPIDKNAPCEWQRKKNCGGGKFPIIGCIDEKQSNVHHGPVKNTTVNNRENIHRIGPKCHNRWHTLNDPVYSEEEFKDLPHTPEEATPEELIDNELHWRSKK